MRIATGYRIVDEPTQSGLARIAVRPLWPLLGLMLGGAWLAWPWFAINTLALGMRDRQRSFAWIFAAIVGSLAAAIGGVALSRAGSLSPMAAPWFDLGIVLWKLTIGYVLFEKQSRTCELFAYFGGRLQNGIVPLLGAVVYARPALAQWAFQQTSDAVNVAYLVLS